jgi:hypothetical protein
MCRTILKRKAKGMRSLEGRREIKLSSKEMMKSAMEMYDYNSSYSGDGRQSRSVNLRPSHEKVTPRHCLINKI